MNTSTRSPRPLGDMDAPCEGVLARNCQGLGEGLGVRKAWGCRVAPAG